MRAAGAGLEPFFTPPGRAAATMHALLGTCRLNGIEPYAWFKDTLERLPGYPISQVHELLPQAR